MGDRYFTGNDGRSRRTKWRCRGALVLGCLLAAIGCRRDVPPDPPGRDAVESDQPAALIWTEVAEGLRAAKMPNRSQEDAATRFLSLPVEVTGLDFAHHWKPPADYQLEIYSSLPGGGICIGDCDGDQLPDVFLTQPNVGSRLYRNLGNFRFEDTTIMSGLVDNRYGQGATLIDIDNDGDLDLFVCNDEYPNSLFINNGHGHFEDQAVAAGLDFSGASVMVAMADYDRDGDLDVYLVTNRVDPDHPIPAPKKRPDGTFDISEEHREFVDVIVSDDGRPRVIKAAQYDHLYRNNGNGTFTNVSGEAGLVGAYWGLSAVWWDYDRDGWIDLYVSNDFYSPDQLYHNNGDGTFTDVAPTALPHTPWYSMGTDVADINNDGWFDFMGSDMSGTSHYKQKASMGDMSKTSWFLTHPTPRQYMRNSLYLNTGTSRFMEIAQMAGVANTDWTWSLKFGDLDEDGWIDLFVTNGMNRDWTNSDLRNLSNQAASESAKMQIWIDSPQRRDPNLAYRNGGDYRFEDVKAEWGLGAEQVSYGAAFGDLDRDGDLDLVVNNAEQAPYVYRNTTSDSHRVIVRLEGRQNNRGGLGSTIGIKTAAGTQWRQVTNSQGYMASNEPLIHFGLGAAEQIEQLDIIWTDGRRQTYENLPTDHFYAVRETETDSKVAPLRRAPATPLFRPLPVLAEANHAETPFNDYARQPLLPNQLSQLGPGMAWGDVDRDGDPDVFVAGASGQAGRLFMNNGDGTFRAAPDSVWSLDSAAEDMAPLLLDTDGDGDLDLYVVSGGVECAPGDEVLQDRLYLNDGRGNFVKAPLDFLPTMRQSGSVAVAADVDRDGDLDLFVGGRVVPGQYPIAPRSYLLVNDEGRFTDVTETLAPELTEPGLVTSAIWSDGDGDGWSDLIVTLQWGPVQLYHNRSGHLVRSPHAFQGKTGWYNSVIASDLDNDGDMDYVVGNHGWNSKYHASVEQPTLLYYGDFENSGRMRLVEAEFENDTLFPVRGKSCSTNAMPFLGDKFGQFHDFAIASLGEIYSDSRLSSAERFAANSLESGVWMNEGGAAFRFVPLPTLAQASPVFGIVACEVNSDGVPDLLLAQNFFGPQAETGRADGGVSLLLIGKGDGTFRAMPAHESGIVVAGDATAACQVDLDGDGCPELCIAVNDGPMHVFGRTDPASIHSLAVRLVGRRGNRTAIGARVTARLTDGSVQSFEVTSGGGYLSQSSPERYVSVIPGRQLAELAIRWPDGTTSTHKPAGTAKRIVIQQEP